MRIDQLFKKEISSEKKDDKGYCFHGEMPEYCRKCTIQGLIELNTKLYPKTLSGTPNETINPKEVWPQAKDHPRRAEVEEFAYLAALKYGSYDVKLRNQIKLANGLHVKRGTKTLLLENDAIETLKFRFGGIADLWRLFLDAKTHALIYIPKMIYLIPLDMLRLGHD